MTGTIRQLPNGVARKRSGANDSPVDMEAEVMGGHEISSLFRGRLSKSSITDRTKQKPERPRALGYRGAVAGAGSASLHSLDPPRVLEVGPK